MIDAAYPPSDPRAYSPAEQRVQGQIHVAKTAAALANQEELHRIQGGLQSIGLMGERLISSIDNLKDAIVMLNTSVNRLRA